MACLAGIGGRLSVFVQSARDVPEMVLIDDCSVGCGKVILKNSEVPLKSYLVVTDLGIEKSKIVDLKPTDLRKVKEAVKEALTQK